MAHQAPSHESAPLSSSSRFLFTFVLSVGVTWRVLLALRMPVGYDEIFDLSLGLLRMRESAADWLIEVPIERSTAVAPLWWWVQWVPLRVLGEVSLFAIRLVPVALGILLVPIAYLSARRHFSTPAVRLFSIFIVWSDVLAFASTRGEFAESLLLIFVVPLVCMTGAAHRGIIRGVLWAGLILTHVGKGSVITALSFLVEFLALAGQRRWRDLPSLALSIVFPIVAFVLWYTVVEAHYSGRPIVHAVGSFNSFLDLLWAITVEYPRYKAHMTGAPRDAVQLFLDARVWPLTVLAAPVMAFAVIHTFYSAVRSGLAKRRVADEDWRRGALALWTVLGFLVVVLRGAAGARFHLVYLPAAWLLTADVIGGLWPLRARAMSAFWIVTAGWFGFAISWTRWEALSFDWKRGGMAAGLLVAAWLAVNLFAKVRRVSLARIVAWTDAGLIAVVAFTLGAFAWAPAACNGNEPMHGSQSLQLVDAARWPWNIPRSQPTDNMYVYLAHYFLSQKDLRKAEHYAELATRLEPEDGVAWFYLGLVYDEAGRPVDERRRIWRRALELNPESERVGERWERVKD